MSSFEKKEEESLPKEMSELVIAAVADVVVVDTEEKLR